MLIFSVIYLLEIIQPCSNKGNFISEEAYNQAVNDKTDRIRYLENLYNDGKEIIKSKDATIKEKDMVISKSSKEANYYFNKWNETEQYRQVQQMEFIELQAKMAKTVDDKDEQIMASDLAIQAIVKLQQDNKKFFTEVLNLMVNMNEKQGDLIKSAQETQKETMRILEKVVEVSNRMHHEIKKYGENQKALMNIVSDMTEDEQELYAMIR